jgi:hypothetical protein
MNAYVFVWTKAGQGRKVARQIATLPGVQQADCCWGRPEVIAFVEVPDERGLASLVFGGVARFRGVEATETHLVLDSQDGVKCNARSNQYAVSIASKGNGESCPDRS